MELMVSRKGTINWHANVNLGSRVPYTHLISYEERGKPPFLSVPVVDRSWFGVVL